MLALGSEMRHDSWHELLAVLCVFQGIVLEVYQQAGVGGMNTTLSDHFDNTLTLSLPGLFKKGSASLPP